jgi:hypothetical protein
VGGAGDPRASGGGPGRGGDAAADRADRAGPERGPGDPAEADPARGARDYGVRHRGVEPARGLDRGRLLRLAGAPRRQVDRDARRRQRAWDRAGDGDGHVPRVHARQQSARLGSGHAHRADEQPAGG